MRLLRNTRPVLLAMFSDLSGSGSWAVPAALTEFLGNTQRRAQADLTAINRARVVVSCTSSVGAVGAKLAAQYFDGAAWQYLDGVSGPVTTFSGNGVIASPWVTLVAGARGDKQVRFVGLGGDGVTAAGITSAVLQGV